MKPWIKYTLIALMVAIVLTILIVLMHNAAQAKKKKTEIVKVPVPGQLPQGEAVKTFPLKKGSKGNAVGNLQRFLNFSYSGYNLAVDNQFGPATEAAVMKETGGKEISQQYYNDFVVPYISNSLTAGDPNAGVPMNNTDDPAGTGVSDSNYWGNPFGENGSLSVLNPNNWTDPYTWFMN